MSDTLGNVDFHSDYNSLSSQTKETIEAEVRRLIEEGRLRATKLLTERRKELELLAKALVEYESLDREEMEKVIKGETLPGKMKILPDVQIKLPEMLNGAPAGGVGHDGAVSSGETGSHNGDKKSAKEKDGQASL